MRSILFKLALLVCLVCLAGAAWASPWHHRSESDPAESEAKRFAVILVNGRALTGPNNSAQQIGGRILIPVVSVAAALGDTVTVDAAARLVSVRRQDGIAADFDGRLGQVHENGSLVLSVSNSAELFFTPAAGSLMLPAEIVASLLDVGIRFDSDKNAVLITRGDVAHAAFGSGGQGRRPFELFQVDYEYSFNRYQSALLQNLSLNAAGRLADGRFSFNSNSILASGRSVALQTGTFHFDRSNGQRFTAGDFGTGTDLQFLSTAVRGASASVPFGKFVATAFGGRSYSGVFLPIPDPAVQTPLQQQPFVSRSRFDTTVFGFFASSDAANNGRGTSPLGFAAGVMHFDGAERRGDLITSSVSYQRRRFQLQSEFGIGKFAGQRADGSVFSDVGTALDLAGTFQVTDELAFQARYTNISKNFLSPQAGLREPVVLKAASMTWSPRKWLSTSFSASDARRSDDSSQKNSSYTGSIAITPRPRLPQVYLTHTESSSSLLPSSAFSMLTVSKEFSQLRVFVNATRMKLLGTSTLAAQLGANYAISDTNSLEFSQGVADNGAFNGQFDWRSSGLMGGRLNLSAGGGYDHDNGSKFSTFMRFSAGVTLPRQTSLQLNYVQTAAGPTLLLSLKGTLFHKRESRMFLDSPVAEINSYGKMAGRVYQDVDLDGRFDPQVDKPQAGVKVQVDGNRYVLSDENGLYNFDSIPTGNHRVFLDLLSVRADLTFLDADTREVTLTAERSSLSDFRLVRTGRISGRVWLDANENGKVDEGEIPLADVRVVTASGRDTLTDNDGYFAICDLPPGDHVVLIDEKTLPEKMMAESKPLAIRTFPGRETGDVKLAVTMIPAEIKRFGTRAEK